MLNKIDLVDDQHIDALRAQITADLPNFEHIFEISTVTKEGLQALSQQVMVALEAIWRDEEEDPDCREREQLIQRQMQEEGRAKIAELAQARKNAREGSKNANDEDDDDFDVDVEYVND